jgi:hypothetical protein
MSRTDQAQGFTMQHAVEIEDIEEVRRRQDIDDVELRLDIRGLKVGHFVRLTFLTGAGSFEVQLVRITSIRGLEFRGKLVNRPRSRDLKKLTNGVSIPFTAAHIHSLLKRNEAGANGGGGRRS